MKLNPLPITPPEPQFTQSSKETEKMRDAAQKLEAGFLAYMLKTSGLEKAIGSFGGGHGQEQFSSFLIDAYANKLAENHDFGLAEKIFKSLQESANDK